MGLPIQPLSIVYVLTNPAMPGLVKIGKTTRESMERRLGELFSTSVPFPFELVFACKVANPDEVERALHVAFGPNRVNPRREFFEIDPVQAVAILRLLHTEDATPEMQQLVEQSAPKEDAEAGKQFRTRRPNLNFEEMGIPVGSTLYFFRDDHTVTVASPRKVLFNGEETSLTAITRVLLGLDYGVNPGPHWSYGGKSISTIYNETYSEQA